MKAFQFAASIPWAITEAMLKDILGIASRQAVDLKAARAIRKHNEEIQAVQAVQGTRVEGARWATVRSNGVGVLTITGPIFRYADLFSDISGATSVERLSKDFKLLVDNDEVKAIVLAIDSPGGEVNGISEFSDQIFAARGKKPITAYVSHRGTSAAYFIASACDEIVCDQTAMLGSIGVIMAALDTTAADAMLGIKEIHFISSVSPKKNPDPSDPKQSPQIQEVVDALGEVFVSAVARNRGVTREKVLGDYGAGAVIIGATAVAQGLADRIGSFEQVVAELAGNDSSEETQPGSATRAADSNPPAVATIGGDDMSMKDVLAKMFGGLTAEEKKEAAEALGVGEPAGDDKKEAAASTEAAKLPATPPAASTQTGSEEVTRLRTEALEAKKKQFKAEASAFAQSEILAGRLLPGEQQPKEDEYYRAALDDEMNPVTEGKSRVETIKAAQAARPAHVLTEELLKGEVPKGAILLQDTAANDPLAKAVASAEKYAEGRNQDGRQQVSTGPGSRAVN